MFNFKEWLEMAGTGAVYDPNVKPTTFNWWGAPGSTGTSVKEEPIKHWTKVKKDGRRKKRSKRSKK